MVKIIYEKLFKFGFFLYLSKSDTQWEDNGKNIRFGWYPKLIDKPKAWTINLVVGKFFAVFGRLTGKKDA